MITLYSPNIDYLTLTTWDRRIFQHWQALIPPTLDSEEGRIRQYIGKRAGPLFLGEGWQFVTGEGGGKRKHYMLVVSGSEAQDIAGFVQQTGVRCTRIDLQITIDLPEAYSARSLCDALRAATWVRDRDVSLRENGEALDTVYVGSRTSERYWRIYVKEAGEGRYLRFEEEIKGDRAGIVFRRLQTTSLHALLAESLVAFPDEEATGTLALIRAALKDSASNIRLPQKVREPSATMTWLKASVEPAVYRMLNDHDYAADVGKLLARWAVMAADILENPS